jgi:NADH:ubiquinone oxidoreductase subunit 4 (subunit M)
VLTTVLIFMPVAVALAVWLLPLPGLWAGGVALLASLAEVGLWIEALVRFDFEASGLQFDQRQSWFSDLNVSYHVGMFPFSLWLVGLAAVVMAAAVAYAVWIGRERPRA